MHTNDNIDDWNVSISKQTEPEIPLVRKLPLPNLEIRLQQAAHILVNGAIRAAMKQRAEALEKPAKKTPKTAPEPMSEIQTSPEFRPGAKENSTSERAEKPSKLTQSDNATPKIFNSSKDLGHQGTELGSIS